LAVPHPSGVAETAAELEGEFAFLEEYRDKIEHLMDLGKSLPPLAPELRTDAHLVRGCQSRVWLVGGSDPETGRLRLQGDSDAMLVRGLIALLLRLYDDRPPREILDNPPDVLERIGLARMLTPSRSNGLYAMVGRIRQLAEAAIA
jgi:cysteine desulfuration protein SufE